MKEKNNKVYKISKIKLWQTTTILLSIILIISILTKGFTFTGFTIKQTTKQLYNKNDPFLGPKNAKIIVIEFSDFQCPYCGVAAGTNELLINKFKQRDPSYEPAVPKLKELAEQGKIKLVFKNFPLSFHKYAQKAAEAAECAHEQGKFWQYHDLLFKNQDALSTQDLKNYAKQINLNTEKFNSCLDSGRMIKEIKKDLEHAKQADISGTPSFIVNGNLIQGAQPFSSFEPYLK